MFDTWTSANLVTYKDLKNKKFSRRNVVKPKGSYYILNYTISSLSNCLIFLIFNTLLYTSMSKLDNCKYKHSKFQHCFCFVPINKNMKN